MKPIPISNRYLYLILIFFAMTFVILASQQSVQNLSRFMNIVGFIFAILVYMDMRYLQNQHNVTFNLKIIGRSISEPLLQSIYCISIFLYAPVVLAYVIHRRTILVNN
ncbi:MAG: hypothetical protein ACJ0QU_03420 [Halobacteriales archaeon]